MAILEKRLWTKNKSNCHVCNCEFQRIFSFKFTFLFPHHCRICGECICDTCSTYRSYGNYSHFRICLICDVERKRLLQKESESSQYRVCIMMDTKSFSINRHLDFTSDIYGMSAIVKRCKNRGISVGDVLVSVNSCDTLFLSLEAIVHMINHANYPIILEFIPEREYYNFISVVLERIRGKQKKKQRPRMMDSEINTDDERNGCDVEESPSIYSFWTSRSKKSRENEEQLKSKSMRENQSKSVSSHSGKTRNFSFIDGVELKQLKDERAQYLAGVSQSNTIIESDNISGKNEQFIGSIRNENKDRTLNSSMQAQ